MKHILSLLLALAFLQSAAQQPKAYQLYDSAGNQTSWETMTEDFRSQDLVFFGELHNSAIAHWLQLELTKEMHLKMNGKLKLGAEMFEADNQILIDEYFEGIIKQKNFEEEARLWKNYKTDYKPLLEFAKENKLDFIATNVPRRYAAAVNKKGFDVLTELSDDAKEWLPPLPIPFDKNLPGYKKMQKMMAHMPGNKGEASHMIQAQAIKDATMAHFITQNLQKEWLFLHFNGSFHSENHDGIVWYIEQYSPEAKLKTITTVTQKNISELSSKNKNKADYIIVIDDDVTTTY